ncbi:MAG: AGE family epimerase/isomerase [Bradyrhizobium sp.]|nr:MAG: AGE family epimerase/isomerase [Bradyrhizobium sp.]
MSPTEAMPTPRRDDPAHRAWLAAQAEALFNFFQPNLIVASGGFANLDERGRPMPAERVRPLHETTRMVHCFAIARLLGRKGADDIIDHGVKAIRTRHRDARHGGYFWSFDDHGPRERDKLAYGHGHVLLAAASAKCVGHPEADALIADIAEVIATRFWEADWGASAEEFREDWTPFSAYRGQNANMHLTEALMAAYEATGERDFLDKAESIADLILRRAAAGNGWFVPEHYTDRWQVDRDYKGSDMFRPFGVTPGHALEWTRLALQLWELGGRRLAWLPDAARSLLERAVGQGWDKTRGGLYYTLEWSGAPRVRDRLWWPCCEGIGAAAFLAAHGGGELADDWYARFWTFADQHLIDRRWGGWRPQLDDSLQPVERYFTGKPDLYHAVQACLIPLYPADASLTRGIINAAAKRAKDATS